MTEKNNERTTRRCPDCVTEIRRGKTLLVVSGYFKQGSTATVADKMIKVLETELPTTSFVSSLIPKTMRPPFHHM